MSDSRAADLPYLLPTEVMATLATSARAARDRMEAEAQEASSRAISASSLSNRLQQVTLAAVEQGIGEHRTRLESARETLSIMTDALNDLESHIEALRLTVDDISQTVATSQARRTDLRQAIGAFSSEFATSPRMIGEAVDDHGSDVARAIEKIEVVFSAGKVKTVETTTNINQATTDILSALSRLADGIENTTVNKGLRPWELAITGGREEIGTYRGLTFTSVSGSAKLLTGEIGNAAEHGAEALGESASAASAILGKVNQIMQSVRAVQAALRAASGGL